MDAIQTLIAALDQSKISANQQPVIVQIDLLVAALNEIEAAIGGGSGSLTVTDGTHTVTPTTDLIFSGATVSGTTPNATVTVAGGVTFANPSATGGPIAVNGVAATAMRSDSCPAIQKASSSQFGIAQVDNVSMTSASGVISSIGNGTLVYNPPGAAKFTNNINGGAGSISISDVTNVGTVLSYGAIGASDALRGYDVATPATPWTLTIRITAPMFTGNVQYGIYLTDGSGKIITFGINIGSGALFQLLVINWTNATTFSATTATLNLSVPEMQIRVTDNGTNLLYSFSYDGNEFIQVASVSRTAFLTSGPTRAGFFYNGHNNASLTLNSFATCSYWNGI